MCNAQLGLEPPKPEITVQSHLPALLLWLLHAEGLCESAKSAQLAESRKPAVSVNSSMCVQGTLVPQPTCICLLRKCRALWGRAMHVHCRSCDFLFTEAVEGGYGIQTPLITLNLTSYPHAQFNALKYTCTFGMP